MPYVAIRESPLQNDGPPPSWPGVAIHESPLLQVDDDIVGSHLDADIVVAVGKAVTVLHDNIPAAGGGGGHDQLAPDRAVARG